MIWAIYSLPFILLVFSGPIILGLEITSLTGLLCGIISVLYLTLAIHLGESDD